MKASAEYKVYSEHGTDDNLDYLYMEANDVSETKRKGILSKAFSAVNTLISSVVKTIADALGLTTERDENSKVKIPMQKVSTFKVLKELYKRVAFNVGNFIILSSILSKITDTINHLRTTKYSKQEKRDMEVSILEVRKMLNDTESMVKDTKNFISELENYDYSKEDIGNRSSDINDTHPNKDHNGLPTINPSKNISKDISKIEERFNDLKARYQKAGLKMSQSIVSKYNTYLNNLKRSNDSLIRQSGMANNTKYKTHKELYINDVRDILRYINEDIKKIKDLHTKADLYLKFKMSNKPTTESVTVATNKPKESGFGIVKGLVFAMKTILQLSLGIAGSLLSALGKATTAVSK